MFVCLFDRPQDYLQSHERISYVLGRVGLFVCMFVCLFDRPQDYLQSHERISYVSGRVGLFVGMFVCPSVHRITYKVMNRFVHSTGDIVASEL